MPGDSHAHDDCSHVDQANSSLPEIGEPVHAERNHDGVTKFVGCETRSFVFGSQRHEDIRWDFLFEHNVRGHTIATHGGSGCASNLYAAIDPLSSTRSAASFYHFFLQCIVSTLGEDRK